MKLDDTFTRMSFRATEALGHWPATAVVGFVTLLWLCIGPIMAWSDSWQLLINTPTTIFEAYTGLFALAATNRIEARNHALLDRQEKMLANMQVILEALQVDETKVLGFEESILDKFEGMYADA